MKWFLLVNAIAATALAQDGITPGGYHPHSYQRPKIQGATAHEQVNFLPDYRSWERVDIYVPGDVKQDERRPCVILFYGGGWGGKVGGFKGAIQPLVDRGYVVAVPDYVLGASHPVPLAMWDGAAAIRFLRAHAGKYHIDAERIGAWGFSAGGWMIQHLCPSDSGTLELVTVEKSPQRVDGLFHMIDPRPDLADIPIQLQAVATDWAAGRIAKIVPDNIDESIAGAQRAKRPAEHWLRPWLTADDPPLFTCHNDPQEIPRAIKLLRAAGVPCQSTFLDVKNTHVPSFNTPAMSKSGRPTTWGLRNIEFFDEVLKSPSQATSPEFFPHGVPIDGPTMVTIRTVHPDGAIHYTLDGSPPTEASPRYQKAVDVRPGQTLRAIVVKPGVKPSRITSANYAKVSSPAPVIKRPVGVLAAEAGKPFSYQMELEHGADVRWYIAGKFIGRVPAAYEQGVEEKQRKSFPAWLSINHETGKLSGTPTEPGLNLVLVTANSQTPECRVLTDTVRLAVVVAQR